MENFEFIVVGAGVMGGSTAYHLAKEGRRVLLLEQFEIGHERGSSHGESRIFRFAYPQPEYSRFAMQSKPLWRALEVDAGEQLLLETGGLDLADDPSGFANVREVENTLQGLHAHYETFTRAQLAAHYPQWHVGPDGIGVYSPDAGILLATKCVVVAAQTAHKFGAVVRDHERVTQLVTDGSRARVTTNKAVYEADKVILTAGPWMNDLIGDIGWRLPLRTEKEQVVYFHSAAGSALAQFRPGAFPIFLHYRTEHVYGFPDLGNGVKVGFHHAGHYINHPNEQDGVPDAGDLLRMSRYIQNFLPALDATPRNPLSCLYANTPDHDFIIDTVPNVPNVLVGSPCSGHGFKFAIGVGRALADLAVHGATAMSINHVRKLQSGQYAQAL
jgi:sarcosine oxidase